MIHNQPTSLDAAFDRASKTEQGRALANVWMGTLCELRVLLRDAEAAALHAMSQLDAEPNAPEIPETSRPCCYRHPQHAAGGCSCGETRCTQDSTPAGIAAPAVEATPGPETSPVAGAGQMSRNELHESTLVALVDADQCSDHTIQTRVHTLLRESLRNARNSVDTSRAQRKYEDAVKLLGGVK